MPGSRPETHPQDGSPASSAVRAQDAPDAEPTLAATPGAPPGEAPGAPLDEALGLRERQRRASLQHIHEAALALANAKGVADTTVAEIAERAGVSRRTLFNYYATKEDAIVGLARTELHQQALEEYLAAPADEDELTRIVMLIVRTLQPMLLEGQTPQQRREIVAAHPELKFSILHRYNEVQDQVCEAVMSRLDDTKAEMLVALAGMIVRYGMRHHPRLLTNPSLAAFTPIIRAFREIMKATA